MTNGTAMADGNVAVPLPKEVLEDFPQLREKAVIDILNGMEVASDHLRYRDENPGTMVSRVWSVLTGGTMRRQQALDRSLEGVLNGIKEWQVAFQEAQPKSDLAITRVARHLHEIRRFEMELEAKHRHLQQDVTAIKQQLAEHKELTDKKFSDLREALRRECTGRRAWDAVGLVRSRWERGTFDAFPAFLRAVLAANELYWSDFGTFLRLNGASEQDAAKLCEYARNTLAALTRNSAAGERQRPRTIEDWLAAPAETSLSADRRDVTIYLLEDAPLDVQPLAASAVTRLHGPDGALPRNVPRLMLPKYVGEFAVREVERRIEAEDGERGRGQR